jgi:hypothetical protein
VGEIVTEEDAVALGNGYVSGSLYSFKGEYTNAVDSPSMRIDPKDTRNADPAISSIRWDIALIFLIGIGLRLYLRWNIMLVFGS